MTSGLTSRHLLRGERSPENSEAAQRVDALLTARPENDRRILELRFLRGSSVRATARELGLSETTVKVFQFRTLHRAGRDRSMS